MPDITTFKYVTSFGRFPDDAAELDRILATPEGQGLAKAAYKRMQRQIDVMFEAALTPIPAPELPVITWTPGDLLWGYRCA